MRKISKNRIKHIQELYLNGLSEREIAKAIHTSKSTVSKYLKSDKFRALKVRNKNKSYENIRHINKKKQAPYHFANILQKQSNKLELKALKEIQFKNYLKFKRN